MLAHRSLPSELVSVLFLFASVRPSAALYGNTTAACNAGFEWELNINGQTSCAVVASLLSSCQKSPYTLPSIPSGNYAYPGPTSTNTSSHPYNRCLCSVPIYSLLAACSACQGATFVPFKTHTESCNASFTGDDKGALVGLPGQADEAVRNGTVIPSWATFDWANATGGTFNVAQARQIAIANSSFPASDLAAVKAESSSVAPTAASTGSIVPIKATAAAQSTSSQAAYANPNGNGGGGDNAGAIAGGIVGGVAILSATGLAMYWLLLKTRDRRAPFPGGIGPVPGGGSAARRVTSWDTTQQHPSSSSVSPGAAGGGTVGGLQRQASQWARPGVSPMTGKPLVQQQQQYYLPQQQQRPNHRPGMSFVSAAGEYEFPMPPSGADALARSRSASVSQSQQGHARSFSQQQQQRPNIAVQTSGHGFPQQQQRVSYRDHPLPLPPSSSVSRSAFTSPSSGGQGLSAASGGGSHQGPISPAGPRPMMRQAAGSNQGVTIVNMDRPFVPPPPQPQRGGSGRSLPPVPPQAQAQTHTNWL